MTNAIVAPSGGGTRQNDAGQNLYNDIRSTSKAIEDGDWLEAGMGVTKVAMDIIGLSGDPMGAISSAGVGWVLNAVSFLREPFDVLLGDPNAITSSSSSWGSVCTGMGQTAELYREASTQQTQSWVGTAADGYRATSANQADALAALGEASRGVSSAMQQAGQLLASVRKKVLDLINEAVQKIIQICIEALAKSWLSFGASVAMGIAQSVTKAVQTAQKLIQEIQKFVQGLQKIIKTVQQIIKVAKEVKRLLEMIGGKASGEQQTTLSNHQIGGGMGAVPNPSDPGGTAPRALPAPAPVQAPPVLAQNTPRTGPVSQNGWPVDPPRGPRTIPGTNVRVNVADGPAGDVLMHVLGQVQSRVEDISLNSAAGEHDDWGYANRNVRGSEAVSNHASATAVDINATRHGLGERGTFTPAQTAEIRAILAEVDNVVRWGGDYRGRADEMHFEIVGSVEQVTAVADRLRRANVGQ